LGTAKDAALEVDFDFLCELCGSSSANSALKGFLRETERQNILIAEFAKKGRKVRRESQERRNSRTTSEGEVT
jgi:hypothetical protein